MDEMAREIRALKVQVQRMADAMQRREERASYQAEYYKKNKKKKSDKVALKRATRLKCDRHIFEGLRRYDVPHGKWAQKMREFVEQGRSVYNWLSWLAWSWNQDTWQFKPITRSGGYYNVFIGMSGNKALRSRYTERDITGHLRVTTFTTKLQVEIFSNALFWKYAFRTVGIVASELEEDDWFLNKLPKRWRDVIEVLKGAQSGYKIPNSEFCFNPDETDLKIASKAYGHVRVVLEQVWACTMKNFFAQEEPFKMSV
jgi:hypothetical protein